MGGTARGGLRLRRRATNSEAGILASRCPGRGRGDAGAGREARRWREPAQKRGREAAWGASRARCGVRVCVARALACVSVVVYLRCVSGRNAPPAPALCFRLALAQARVMVPQ